MKFMFRRLATASSEKAPQFKDKPKGTVEAIQIKKSTPNMNLDSGLLLSMVWNSILNPPNTDPT